MRGLRNALFGIVLLAVLMSSVAGGEPPRRSKKRWIASVAVLAAANLLDARSSAGRQEGNAMLAGPDGRFSGRRAFALKSAGTGGLLLVESLLMRRRGSDDLYGPAAMVNFAAAGALAAAAARNWTVPKAQ